MSYLAGIALFSGDAESMKSTEGVSREFYTKRAKIKELKAQGFGYLQVQL
jgi:hypothetical protein